MTRAVDGFQGECRRRFPLAVGQLMAACAICLSVTGAHAETSSWTPRPNAAPAAAAAQKPAPKTLAKPPSIGPQGGQLPAGRLPDARPETSTFQPSAKTNVSQKMPVTGEDAAVIAFAQGQYLTAKKLAEADAEKNVAVAHTILGRIYAEGLGVPRNETLAAQWFERGAALGDTEAALAFGMMLAEGTGIAKDKIKAGEMFEFVARSGHALANYNLALLFLTGQGKPENPGRAAQHLTYAAEKGVAAAQYDLATLYIEGIGVAPDAFEASRWMRRAADQGMRIAEFDYAVMLLRGMGLNADKPKAVDYLRAAAEKGVAGAQNRMAYLNLEGVLMRMSQVDAVKWRILARDRGLADAELDKIVGQMPAKVKADGERAARDFQERSAAEFGQ